MKLTDDDITDIIEAMSTAAPEPGHLGFVPDVLPIVSLPPGFSFAPETERAPTSPMEPLATGTTRTLP